MEMWRRRPLRRINRRGRWFHIFSSTMLKVFALKVKSEMVVALAGDIQVAV
jgi:hypothetical protein